MARAAVRRRLTWQAAQVLDVRRETSRASRLVLQVPDWPGHRPGQHLDVRLTAPDGYTAQRSYSIASGPEQPQVELLVEELPDGEVSPYLGGELRAGDQLEVRGPVGGWFVWDTTLGGPVQLLAGGSGVVPFLAMLEHHRAAGSDVPVRLLYSARTLEDVLARERLAEADPGVAVTLALTRAAPEGWTGLTGRVDAAVLQAHALSPQDAPRVYVCGPTGFVEAVSAALVELGHPAAARVPSGSVRAARDPRPGTPGGPMTTGTRRLDGNAAAGPLRELFGVDLSAALLTCAHCTGTVALAAHHLYADAPALVLRCPGCTEVVLRYAVTGGRVRLDLTGTRLLVVDLPAP